VDRQSLALQYATSANLAARIALHQRCSTNPYGLQRWIFDRLRLASGQRVLEVACGTGSLWLENRDRIPPLANRVLSDSSLSMLDTTRRGTGDASFVGCALPDLPFADNVFDVAIANHMLYHVADRERGLREMRRLLRRGGLLFVATNGQAHLREIKLLMREFAIDPGDVSASFTLENGEEQLRRVFADLRRDDYVDNLRVTDPELLLAYIASVSPRAREVVEGQGDAMRDAIEACIARDGAFYVTKSTGAFTATRG
jgi:ubiquinone/menaquinone biosynthesis C-methylase UbiE